MNQSQSEITLAQLVDEFTTAGIFQLMGEAATLVAEHLDDPEECLGLPLAFFRVGKKLELCWRQELNNLVEGYKNDGRLELG